MASNYSRRGRLGQLVRCKIFMFMNDTGVLQREDVRRCPRGVRGVVSATCAFRLALEGDSEVTLRAMPTHATPTRTP